MAVESLFCKRGTGKAVWPGHCDLPRAAAYTHGSNWPPCPSCRISAQRELGISEWFTSQSGHVPSDRLSVEIPLRLSHSGLRVAKFIKVTVIEKASSKDTAKDRRVPTS